MRAYAALIERAELAPLQDLVRRLRLTTRDRDYRLALEPIFRADADDVESTIDFAGLADRWDELAGGHVRNAVLRAAFLAAAEDGTITSDPLERAARGESRAMGNIVDGGS